MSKELSPSTCQKKDVVQVVLLFSRFVMVAISGIFDDLTTISPPAAYGRPFSTSPSSFTDSKGSDQKAP